MKNISFAIIVALICAPLADIAFSQIWITATISILAFVFSLIGLIEKDKAERLNNISAITKLDGILDFINKSSDANNQHCEELISCITSFEMHQKELSEKQSQNAACILNQSIDALKSQYETFQQNISNAISSINEQIKSISNNCATGNKQTDIIVSLNEFKVDVKNKTKVFDEFKNEINSLSQMVKTGSDTMKLTQNTILQQLEEQIRNAQTQSVKMSEEQIRIVEGFVTNIKDEFNHSIVEFQNAAKKQTESLCNSIGSQITQLEDASTEQTNIIKDFLSNMEEELSDVLSDFQSNSQKQTDIIKNQLDNNLDELTSMFDDIQEQMISIYTSPNNEELEVMKELQKLCSK